MKIIVREITLDEARDVRFLFHMREMLECLASTGLANPLIPSDLDERILQVVLEEALLGAFTTEGGIAGVAVIRYHPGFFYHSVLIDDVIISEHFREHDIETLLVKKANELAHSYGASRITRKASRALVGRIT